MQSVFINNIRLSPLVYRMNPRYWSAKMLMVLTICLLPFVGFSQKKLRIDGTLSEGSGRLADGKVLIKEGGSTINTVTTNASGKFAFELPINSLYMVEFTKAGYVTKRIEVDTRDIPEADVDKANLYYGGWKVELFEAALDLDASILNQPIGKVTYNASYLQFANDNKYTKSIQRQLDQLLADVAAARREEERRKRQLEEDYQLAIEDGDAFFKEGDFENALFQFQAALQLKPDESYPTKMIAKAQEEMGNAAELEEQYAALLTQADDLFNEEKYDEAITTYQQAVGIKPKEKYPKEQIELAQKEKLRLAEEKAQKEQYDATIAEADALFAAENWSQAKDKYKAALVILKEEQYPKDQITAIDAKLDEAEALEKQYADALKAGEDALKKQDYDAAKPYFEEAQRLKPNEARPPAAIQEIETAIAALAAAKVAEEAAEKERLAKLEADYTAAIEAGDQAFESQQYSEAIASYQSALQLKPEETYPTGQIDKANAAIASLAEADKAYQGFMKDGDAAKSKESYDEALTAYQAALGAKPEDAAATAAIAEVNGLIQAKADAEAAAAAELQAKYDGFITQADAAYEGKDLQGAIGFYNQALEVKADEQYPKDQIQKINTELASLADAEEAYQGFMKSGESAKSKESYDEALTAYQSALGVKPEDAAATAAIAEVNGLIQAKADAEAAAAAELQAKYDGFITQADAAYEGKDLQGAIGFYNQALEVKADEQYPKDQIQKINVELASLADAEEAYAMHMKSGEDAKKSEDYQTALSSYQSALGVKPEDAAAIAAITEVNGLIQAKADAEAAAAAELQAKYDGFITQADAAYEGKDLQGAIGFYNQALEVKADEQYPKDQIQKINTELASLADAEEAYAMHMKNGEDAKKSEDYQTALSSYQSALGVKPEDATATAAIAEVNGLIQAKADAEAAAAAELQAKYDGFITQADAAYEGKDLQGAIGFYNQALEVKANEQYPKDQIQKINAEIAGIEATEASYAQHMKTGRDLQSKESYEEARNAYQRALEVKPGEADATAAIAAVNGILEAAAAALAAQQAEEARIKAENQKAYDEAIAVADAALAEGAYQKALGQYRVATKILPEEPYPVTKIAEIEETLQNQAVAAEQYQLTIQKADGLFQQSNWEEAKSAYEEAQTLKPDESYPGSQIEKIDAQLAKLAALAAAEAERKAEEQARIDQAYNEAIQQGDDQVAAEQYKTAITKYEEALSIKPEETYPQSQIDMLNQKLGDLAAAEEARLKAEAEEKARRERYQMLIDNGDVLFGEKRFDEAKGKYQEAGNIYPEEAYPRDQIAKIDAEVAAIAAAEEAARQAEAARLKLEADYKQAILDGNQAFETDDLITARSAYTKAAELKPNETVPPAKLKLVDEREAELARIAEEKRLAEERERQRQEDYQNYMASGLSAFNNEEYSEATEAYQNASDLYPQEPEPKAQLKKIKDIVDEQKRIAAQNAANDTEYNYELAKKYPQGRTENVTEKGNKTVTQIVIVTGNRGDEYIKERYSWGQEFYLKNQKPYNKNNWLRETRK